MNNKKTNNLKKILGAKKPLSGEIFIPPDKSISHRAGMFSALTKSKVSLYNFSKGADCLSTLSVLKSLGADVKFTSENDLIIDATNCFLAFDGILDAGNSGTTIRLISGILTGHTDFKSTLTGDVSLQKRPMARIINPLRLMGADISSVNNDNKAPLTIQGNQLEGIEYNSPIASAQVKSAILLAGLNANGSTTVIEPHKSRDHTERLLKYLGAEIEYCHPELTAFQGENLSRRKCPYAGISGSQCTKILNQVQNDNGVNIVKVTKSTLTPKNITIPGDISSAAFFMAAAAIVPDSNITIKNVGLNPTRTGIIDILEKMGADISIFDKRIECGEEVGNVTVAYSDLKGITIEGDVIPRLIDELPVITILATQAEGKTTIKDAQDLRNKESDRITAVCNELKKTGANIQETRDGFIIEGKTKLQGECTLYTYHDHRLAMSWYIAGLITQKPLLIDGFAWASISFPEFEKLMQELL